MLISQIFFAVIILLGFQTAHADPLYRMVEQEESGYENELLAQGELEDEFSVGSGQENMVAYEDEFDEHSDEMLPWGASPNEDLTSFIEEHAKEAYRDYEEEFAYDDEGDDFDQPYRSPSLERVPSAKKQQRVVEAPRKSSKQVASKQQRSPNKKMNAKNKKNVAKQTVRSSAKKKVAAAPKAKQRSQKSKKQVAAKEGRAKVTKRREVALHKRRVMKNKENVSQNSVRKKPRERIVYDEE